MMGSSCWSGAGFGLVDSVSDILESSWVGGTREKSLVLDYVRHGLQQSSLLPYLTPEIMQAEVYVVLVKELIITWCASGATEPGSS